MPEAGTATVLEPLPLAGTFNVRDVGGLPAPPGRVRRGVLLRGDALAGIDDPSRRFLTGIGLRTVIDLRERAERELRPDALGDLEVRELPLPLYGAEEAAERDPAPLGIAPDEGLGELYLRLLEHRGERIAEVVGELAEPGALPALVHCTGGKDRTGLVVALTLGAVGVEEPAIVADYARSGPLLARLPLEEIERWVAAADSRLDPSVAVRAEAAWMEAALAWLDDRHGGARGYLLEHGLGESRLDRLQRALIEGGDR